VIRDPWGKQAHLRLGEQYRIDPAQLPIEEVEMILGKGTVVFSR
jgi:DNA polymerase-3 subunit alpha